MAIYIELNLALVDLIFNLEDKEQIQFNIKKINEFFNTNEIEESVKLDFLSKLTKNVLTYYSSKNEEINNEAYLTLEEIINQISIFKTFFITEDYIRFLKYLTDRKYQKELDDTNFLKDNLIKLENIYEEHIKYAIAVKMLDIILIRKLIIELKKELMYIKNTIKELKDRVNTYYFSIPVL